MPIVSRLYLAGSEVSFSNKSHDLVVDADRITIVSKISFRPRGVVIKGFLISNTSDGSDGLESSEGLEGMEEWRNLRDGKNRGDRKD